MIIIVVYIKLGVSMSQAVQGHFMECYLCLKCSMFGGLYCQCYNLLYAVIRPHPKLSNAQSVVSHSHYLQQTTNLYR